MRFVLAFVLAAACLALAPCHCQAGPLGVFPLVKVYHHTAYYPMPVGGPAPQAVAVEQLAAPVAAPAVISYATSGVTSTVSYGPAFAVGPAFVEYTVTPTRRGQLRRLLLP